MNKKKPNGYWTLELITKEALKYNTKKEFLENCGGAFGGAKRAGILNDVCSHMQTRKPSGYWTDDNIHTEAKKYNTKKEFEVGSISAYTIAHRNGILDSVCSHMGGNTQWTDEMIAKEALKYDNKHDFRNAEQGAFSGAYKRGIMDEVCSHMERGMNGFDRTKAATLYYLKINGGEAYKIGITNKTVEERFKNYELDKIEILKAWSYPFGMDAYDTEQKILKEYAYAKYNGEPILNNGNSEMFTHDVLGLDYPDNNTSAVRM